MHATTAENGLTVMVCERRDPASCALFPIALQRVIDFCRKWDSDANVQVLIDVLWANFAAQKPATVVLLLIDPLGNVVGHLLVSLEDWMGCRMCSILQLEVDVPLTAEVTQPAYEWIEEWAVRSDAQYFQCLAREESVARLFQFRYGFKRSRILMRRRLPALATDGEFVAPETLVAGENQPEV